MSNCHKKGTQILIQENDEMTEFKIYESKNGEMVFLDEFTAPEEVELFLKRLEAQRPNDDIVLRFI